MKTKKIKFAILIKNGSYFRVTEITTKDFGDDQLVVVADELKKDDFLTLNELENQIIVHRPERGL